MVNPIVCSKIDEGGYTKDIELTMILRKKQAELNELKK